MAAYDCNRLSYLSSATERRRPAPALLSKVATLSLKSLQRMSRTLTTTEGPHLSRIHNTALACDWRWSQRALKDADTRAPIVAERGREQPEPPRLQAGCPGVLVERRPGRHAPCESTRARAPEDLEEHKRSS